MTSRFVIQLIVLVSFAGLGICGCSDEAYSSTQTVQTAIKKLRDATAVSYHYQQKSDNRFNETTYYDSAYVSWFQVNNSHHGFGLQIDYGNLEYQYDGRQFVELNHIDKTRLIHDPVEFATDSNYFESTSAFSTNPIQFSNLAKLPAIGDTLLDGQLLYVLKSETQSQSKSDHSATVTYQTFWLVDPEVAELIEVRSIIIRNGDTLQVVGHHFSDYTFNNSSGITSDTDRNTSAYKIVFGDEVTAPASIDVGDQLGNKTYMDVEQNEVVLFGKSQSMSMVMFSFIGCAPCERALKDFADSDYAFGKSRVGYYSSFQNQGDVLQRYLKSKACPLSAFGKESQMIDDFNLFHAPTFVFIDSSGVVVDILEGYDDEVRSEIFKLMAISQ